ncbi:MAG: type 3 dihydrofolate reductase [Gammaproteobacteria bacterium]|nr:MAG: type 3 dihydrofolate reductase [Gammaproteobacteria bacterium]
MSQSPRIALIAAVAANGVIGQDNAMPWHLPADLAHFKRITLGKPVIMGRRTCESIGRPLPGRLNIVVSSQPDLAIEGCEVVDSLEAALERARQEDPEEIMIIGGARIYEQALPLADRLYLTLIDSRPEGDARFPEWSSRDWKVVQRDFMLPDADNPWSLTFLTLDRR